jgi:2-polyprenyl-3-methyl-5-hydroxy-6-metoxy-1,4-benzoquinol methylase
VNSTYGYHEVTPKPTEKELKKYYAEKYYQEELATYAKHYEKEELDYFRGKIEQKDYIIKQILNRNSGIDLLDIGCGEGFALDFYYEKGWNVFGVDFSDYGLSNNHPHLLPFLRQGDIFEEVNQLVKEKRQFDVVWLDNVLEHVINPIALLTQCSELTKSGGVLVIEVPNDYSNFQTALIGNEKVNRKYWEAYPDHLNYFTYQSLKNVCEAHGWLTSKVISDFPIEWYLANEKSNYVRSKDFGKSAHQGRMFIENFLHSEHKSNLVTLIDFYEAMAKVGQGRQLIGFFTKE